MEIRPGDKCYENRTSGTRYIKKHLIRRIRKSREYLFAKVDNFFQSDEAVDKNTIDYLVVVQFAFVLFS